MTLSASLLQALALLLISLVVGSMFGIWRGYVAADYSPATFIEVHQSAVRGLNVLLPAIALLSLILTAILAFLARGSHPAFALYLGAIVAVIAGGLVTRFGNQPINAEVMLWTADTLPANWEELRDRWWTWHIVRFVVTALAEMLLIGAVFAHRDSFTS